MTRLSKRSIFKLAELALAQTGQSADPHELVIKNVGDQEALAVEELLKAAYQYACVEEILKNAGGWENAKKEYEKFLRNDQPKRIELDHAGNAYFILPDRANVALMEKSVAFMKEEIMGAIRVKPKIIAELPVKGDFHSMATLTKEGDPEIAHQIGMDCAVKFGNAVSQMAHYYGVRELNKSQQPVIALPKVHMSKDQAVVSLVLVDHAVHSALVRQLKKEQSAFLG